MHYSIDLFTAGSLIIDNWLVVRMLFASLALLILFID